MRDRRRYEPAQRIGADVLRAAAEPEPVSRSAMLPRRHLADDEQRERDDRERVANPATAPASRRSCSRAGERGQHRHANRLRREHDDDEDAVRGEETVRLLRAAELVRDDDADDRGEARHDERRRTR